MQTNNEWTKQFYNEEAQKVLAERGKLWSPELQEQASKDWIDLFADVKAASTKGVKPESTEGQALAVRWDKLVGAFTGGHPAVADGLKSVWANAGQLPAETQQQMKPFKDAMSAEVCAFIAQARAAAAKA
jgi:hypothetical protein